MSYEDDFIDWVAENRTGFLGGLADEGARELREVGIFGNPFQECSSMPRSTQSREDNILDYFQTTDLAIAQVILRLATTAVKARVAKSTEARDRALAAQKKTAKVKAKASPAAPSALDALIGKPAAAPKGKAKSKGPKKSHKKQVKPAAVAPPAAEEEFDLPEGGDDSGIDGRG